MFWYAWRDGETKTGIVSVLVIVLVLVPTLPAEPVEPQPQNLVDGKHETLEKLKGPLGVGFSAKALRFRA